MNDAEFVKELVRRGSNTSDRYFQYAHLVAVMLDKALLESLEQLVDGPVHDGNVISKQSRNELLSIGLAMRVCRDGNQGFTGATYFAYSVNKVAKDIKSGNVGS